MRGDKMMMQCLATLLLLFTVACFVPLLSVYSYLFDVSYVGILIAVWLCVYYRQMQMMNAGLMQISSRCGRQQGN